jgi:hypothetical protein
MRDEWPQPLPAKPLLNYPQRCTPVRGEIPSQPVVDTEVQLTAFQVIRLLFRQHGRPSTVQFDDLPHVFRVSQPGSVIRFVLHERSFKKTS